MFVTSLSKGKICINRTKQNKKNFINIEKYSVCAYIIEKNKKKRARQNEYRRKYRAKNNKLKD